MKPTDKQKQFVWEQCGFKYREKIKLGTITFTDKKKKPEDFYDHAGWVSPDGKAILLGEGLPRQYEGLCEVVKLDFNNLLEYAVPKLSQYSLYWTKKRGIVRATAGVVYPPDKDNTTSIERIYAVENEVPADAFFEAVYKALGGE